MFFSLDGYRIAPMIAFGELSEQQPQQWRHNHSQCPSEQNLERVVYPEVYARVADDKRVGRHHYGEPSSAYHQRGEQADAHTG